MIRPYEFIKKCATANEPDALELAEAPCIYVGTQSAAEFGWNVTRSLF